MADIAKLFGADPNFAGSELSDVLDFEIELAKVSYTNVLIIISIQGGRKRLDT